MVLYRGIRAKECDVAQALAACLGNSPLWIAHDWVAVLDALVFHHTHAGISFPCPYASFPIGVAGKIRCRQGGPAHQSNIISQGHVLVIGVRPDVPLGFKHQD